MGPLLYFFVGRAGRKHVEEAISLRLLVRPLPSLSSNSTYSKLAICTSVSYQSKNDTFGIHDTKGNVIDLKKDNFIDKESLFPGSQVHSGTHELRQQIVAGKQLKALAGCHDHFVFRAAWFVSAEFDIHTFCSISLRFLVVVVLSW